VCSPCRIFYRKDAKDVLVLHVMREEMALRKYLLSGALGWAEGREARRHLKE
jgi:hypothetical protein